jgi:hypothetical protein
VSNIGTVLALALISLAFHIWVMQPRLASNSENDSSKESGSNVASKIRVIVMIPAREGLHHRIVEKATNSLRTLESSNPELELETFIFDKVIPRSYQNSLYPNPPPHPVLLLSQ